VHAMRPSSPNPRRKRNSSSPEWSAFKTPWAIGMTGSLWRKQHPSISAKCGSPLWWRNCTT